MAPAATAVKPKPDNDPIGIRAVLLGPPGSGKGTQVIITYLNTLIVYKSYIIFPKLNSDYSLL